MEAQVIDAFVESEIKINPQKKFQDPAGIQTLQDLLNTSKILLLGPLDREAEDELHKQHCLEASAKF